MQNLSQTQENKAGALRQVPTDKHPIARMFNWLKSQGFYPQYRDYNDFRENPGRKEPEEDNLMSEAALIAMAKAK